MKEKILEDREKRYDRILEIIREYKLPVVCGKLNYPGDEKNTVEALKAVRILKSILKKQYAGFESYSEKLKGFDGESILISVDMEALRAKDMAVEIEESHLLGRVFDIDVYEEDGYSLGGACSIGRAERGLPERKCIVCGENARLCVREGRHKLSEVLNVINKLIEGYGEENEY